MASGTIYIGDYKKMNDVTQPPESLRSDNQNSGSSSSSEHSEKSGNSQNPYAGATIEEQSAETDDFETLDAPSNIFKSELEDAKAKAAETHDRMLRIAAEFENARKRWDKEKEEIRKYAISEFARELLPVIDSFDKAMTLIENAQLKSDTEEGKTLSSVVEGVQIVSKVFHESIKKHGIERVPGKGQPFNPEFHTAIARQVDTALNSDMVVEEFVSGYKIGDRVLRTAMVKVATKD